MAGFYRGMGEDGRLHQYLEMGWAPVPWSHHPPEIRDALRRFKIRPGMKLCYANSQRFLLAASTQDRQLASRLEYREGVCKSSERMFEHGWLSFDGNVLDLTLKDRYEYVEWKTYTMIEIADRCLEMKAYGPVDERALREMLGRAYGVLGGKRGTK